ncbi:MAG TPA: hypothetical protein VIU35_06065 [Chitinophagaceae bacterium]
MAKIILDTVNPSIMTVGELQLFYKENQIGETTRTLAKTYLDILSTKEHIPFSICAIILEDRMKLYRSMGIDISEQQIERIFSITNGYFPSIIFADILVANYNNRVNNLDTLVKTIVIVLKVIVDEYNSSMPENLQITDQEELYTKVQRILLSEAGIDIFAEE